MKLFKDLYNYRELLKSNVKKEIRGKYKGSFLGIIWSFVNPLLTVLVYAIIFPYILRQDQPNYLIFLIVAIIPWNFFTIVLNQGTTTVLANGNIIKKVYFPREILPLAIIRPISGNASFAMMIDIFKNYGVDSYLGRIAAVMQGATDTTIYVISLYFGSIGIKNIRYALKAGLFADFITLIVSILLISFFF